MLTQFGVEGLEGPNVLKRQCLGVRGVCIRCRDRFHAQSHDHL